MAAATVALEQLAELELADARPPADRWADELAGTHRLLRAMSDLLRVLGRGCTLYAVPAEWAAGQDLDGRPPAEELLTAQGEIFAVREQLSTAVRPLESARDRLCRLRFDHDKPVWPHEHARGQAASSSSS